MIIDGGGDVCVCVFKILVRIPVDYPQACLWINCTRTINCSKETHRDSISCFTIDRSNRLST